LSGPRPIRRATGLVRGSVRAQLVLLSFVITAGAIGFVYLYVVPQVRSSLSDERLERLELAGATEEGVLRQAAALRPEVRAQMVSVVAARTDARVALATVEDGSLTEVVADSGGTPPRASRTLAESAVERDAPASEVSSVEGVRVAETAIPLGQAGSLSGLVALISGDLGQVDEDVALIRRQILIAGGIALVAALLAAWLAAGAHARRLRRLESAAVEVAGGDFNVPIPIGNPDEVGELAASFDAMQHRLARLDATRREFIANASHELRTPITTLGGFLELLEHEDPDEEARVQFVRTMREQVDRLTRLSTDLLDLSRLDANALTLSADTVDLSQVASEVATEFGPLAASSGSHLRLSRPEGEKPLARADYQRTAQIMRILIDNAIKHTSEGTTITIETGIRATEALASVADDGPGIPPGSRGRVFERFHTGDPSLGSGLGLAISRELARLMGGELTLVTRPGRTAFTLTLPRGAGSQA
jgi:signal transduction histidine kinase